MRRLIAILLSVSSMAGFAACAAGLPSPTNQDASWAAERWPGTTLAELEAGRTLYVENCAGCHALKAPDAVPPGQWREEISEMRTKRGVDTSDEDAELMARFLETLATRMRQSENAAR